MNFRLSAAAVTIGLMFGHLFKIKLIAGEDKEARVVKNLICGALKHHAKMVVSTKRNFDIEFIANTESQCWGKLVKPGTTVAYLQIDGKQTKKEKLAIGAALLQGRLELVPAADVESLVAKKKENDPPKPGSGEKPSENTPPKTDDNNENANSDGNDDDDDENDGDGETPPAPTTVNDNEPPLD